MIQDIEAEREDNEINGSDGDNSNKIKDNIRSALIKLDKAQYILTEIEASYLAVQDLDPEVYPEVADKYKRIESLLSMLYHFVNDGKLDMDEIAGIIISRTRHNEGDNEQTND